MSRIWAHVCFPTFTFLKIDRLSNSVVTLNVLLGNNYFEMINVLNQFTGNM